MLIQARLNVIDGRVLCPHSCRWETPDHCARCVELARTERDERGETRAIVCRPQVSRLATAIEHLAHA